MCYSLGVDAEGVHLAARACVGRRLRDGRVGRGGRGLMRMWTVQTVVVRDCRGGQPVWLSVFFNPISRCRIQGNFLSNKRGRDNLKKKKNILSRARRDVEKNWT